MTENTINQESMLRVGTILHGTYRIDRYLSSGGFGNTYVATHVDFDETYAIKEFFMKGVTERDSNSATVSVSNSMNQESFLQQKEKFKKEARRLRQLESPYIVRVHDLFEENGTAYYVMDYVDGENLSDLLKRTGHPMSEAEVNGILPQILDALKTVHDAGMWHLDLKPANIMLDKSGQVKLIDFGASKQLNAQKGGATTSTAISYTNGYAPREQMEQNYDKFGPWTDIYALGATLYNLLTNKRPPLPTDIDDDMSQDKHLALPMQNVSEKMKNNILWLMQNNRNRRPQSIDEFVLQMKEVDKVDPISMDEAKTDFVTPKEETIIVDNKNDETNIYTQPVTKSKEEPSKASPSNIENITPTNGIKDNNDGYSKIIGWLGIIIFIALTIIGFIYFSKSPFKSNNYPRPEKALVEKDTIVEEYEDSLADRDWIEIKTPIGECRYAGSFDEEGRPHGFGEAFFKDDRYYKGYFVHGDLNGDNVCFKYGNGDVFIGSLRNNSFYEGKYTIAEDGSYFTGTFKNGQPDKGVWYDKKGNIIEYKR